MVVLCVMCLCPTATSLVCAKFVPVYKFLWESNSAGEEPPVAVGVETDKVGCWLPPAASPSADALQGGGGWCPPPFPSTLCLLLVPCPSILGVTDAVVPCREACAPHHTHPGWEVCPQSSSSCPTLTDLYRSSKVLCDPPSNPLGRQVPLGHRVLCQSLSVTVIKLRARGKD